MSQETLRRLNRAEYQNSIRDLVALEIDAATLLPKDDVSHGFDNRRDAFSRSRCQVLSSCAWRFACSRTK